MVAKFGIKRALKPTIPRKPLTSVGVVGGFDSSTARTFFTVGPIPYFESHKDYLVHLELTLLEVEGEFLLLQSRQHSMEIPVMLIIALAMHYQVIGNVLNRYLLELLEFTPKLSGLYLNSPSCLWSPHLVQSFEIQDEDPLLKRLHCH